MSSELKKGLARYKAYSARLDAMPIVVDQIPYKVGDRVLVSVPTWEGPDTFEEVEGFVSETIYFPSLVLWLDGQDHELCPTVIFDEKTIILQNFGTPTDEELEAIDVQVSFVEAQMAREEDEFSFSVPGLVMRLESDLKLCMSVGQRLEARAIVLEVWLRRRMISGAGPPRSSLVKHIRQSKVQTNQKE